MEKPIGQHIREHFRERWPAYKRADRVSIGLAVVSVGAVLFGEINFARFMASGTASIQFSSHFHQIWHKYISFERD